MDSIDAVSAIYYLAKDAMDRHQAQVEKDALKSAEEIDWKLAYSNLRDRFIRKSEYVGPDVKGNSEAIHALWALKQIETQPGLWRKNLWGPGT